MAFFFFVLLGLYKNKDNVTPKERNQRKKEMKINEMKKIKMWFGKIGK